MDLGEAFAIILIERLGGPRYEGTEAPGLLSEFYDRNPSEDECDAVARMGIEELARAAGLDPSAPTGVLLEALVLPRVALRNARKNDRHKRG